MPTVYQTFQESAEKFPNNPFLHIPSVATKAYQDTGVDLTYRGASQLIEPLRLAYSAAGYGVGHRVALLLENRVDFFLHWLALNGLGVSVAPINGEMPIEEMAYLLDHSESCLAVSIAEKTGVLAAAASHAGISIPIINVYDTDEIPEASSDASNVIPGEQAECALLYTSGSTGKPKGCVLSNEYFLNCGRWYTSLDGLCEQKMGQERLLTPLPMVHMNAMACSSVAMIMSGGCIIQLDRFHPRSWWDTVAETKATIVHYLGVMPAILLNFPESQTERAHQVKFGFGAGVNPRHHQIFETRFGFPLIEAWAMTESGNGGVLIANHEPRHIGTSCIGKPSAAVEVKLVDEKGNEVAAGEPGELLVRAAGDNPWKGFFTEYLKNPEATAEAREGGWLHTGDVIRAGEDGQFHFVDRRKNVIRRSGENISALEVEAILSEHPAIDQVAVAPVPDEIRGDEVMACIVLKPQTENSEATAHAIFKHSYDNLVYFKTPGHIAFVDQLPLTSNQKPKRADLKVLCRELVEQGNCYDLCHLKKRQRS